jgi:hypothetical protein
MTDASTTGEGPTELDHPAIGSLRRAIIDHLVDTSERGAQTVAEILQAMPIGTTRNTLESALRRSHKAGHVERVGPGLYTLAQKPAASPEPEPVSTDSMSEQQWFEALEAWAVDRASWDVDRLGPRPDAPDNKVPADVRSRFADRMRKREQRRKEAAEAAAKRAAADTELRAKLIAATGGNIVPGPGIEDVSPIRAALELVPLDHVLFSIKHKTDRKCYPKNEPATSFREPRLLKAIAEDFCEDVLVPRMVDAWGKAGKADGSPSVAPSATPDVAMQVVSPAKESGPSDESAADPGPMAAAVLPEFGQTATPRHDLPDRPWTETRGSAGRAAGAKPTLGFGGTSQLSQPQPAKRQAEPEPEISEAGWDEICAGFFVGNLVWSRWKWGPPPGESGCRVPLAVLKRNRSA